MHYCQKEPEAMSNSEKNQAVVVELHLFEGIRQAGRAGRAGKQSGGLVSQ